MVVVDSITNFTDCFMLLSYSCILIIEVVTGAWSGYLKFRRYTNVRNELFHDHYTETVPLGRTHSCWIIDPARYRKYDCAAKR